MMKSSNAAVRGLIAALALLLPCMAAAESHVDSGTAAAPIVAAHLNFKIVIPQVLSLQVAGGTEQHASGLTVAVMSTGRDVTLNATVLTAARRSIAQNALCTSRDAHPGPLVCTASMP